MGEVAELTQKLSQSIAQGKGTECRATLEKLRSLDSRFEATLTLQRAQCEMIAGQCETGRGVLRRMFAEQTRLSPGQADRSVESIASQYCQEHQLTPHEQVQRAGTLLTQGAYTEARNDCAQNVAKMKKALKQLKPRDADDRTAETWGRSLFMTGAACHARAGDCAAAWKVFKAEYPVATLAKIPAAQRDRVLSDSFASLVPRCKNPSTP
ncbi:MAG: hypothetical protein R3B13_36030 [Polyangiaceae bacterium]